MWLSPAVIVTIGALMTFGSMWVSPETKDIKLSEVGEGLPVIEIGAVPKVGSGR
jgi:hypothetical protein